MVHFFRVCFYGAGWASDHHTSRTLFLFAKRILLNKYFTCYHDSSYFLSLCVFLSISEIKQKLNVNLVWCQLFPKKKTEEKKNEKSLQTLHLLRALFEAHVPSWWINVSCFHFCCSLFIMLCQHLCFCSGFPTLYILFKPNIEIDNAHTYRIFDFK